MIFLFLYGVTFFLIYATNHSYSGAERIMGWRLGQMDIALKSIFEGRHLLYGVDSFGSKISIGFSDSRGMFIVVPIYAKILGITDALSAYASFQKAMMFPILMIYPALLYLVFRSFVISLIVPFLAINFFYSFTHFTDSYWVQQWVILIAFPLAMILYKYKWRNWFIGIVIIIGLASSFADSVRSYSGLGIIISTVFILALKLGWKRSIKFNIPIMIISYLLISVFVVKGVIYHRDATIGGFSGEDSAHPFFHSIYIGVANGKDNKYGIRYEDGYGDEQAKKINPNVRYLTSEYNAIIKNLYFDLWKKDPGFVLSNYYSKMKLLLEMFKVKVDFILCVLILLFIGRKQILSESSNYKWYVYILLPPLLVGALPGILTIVTYRGGVYTLGYEAVVMWMWMLALFFTLQLVENRFYKKSQ